MIERGERQTRSKGTIVNSDACVCPTTAARSWHVTRHMKTKHGKDAAAGGVGTDPGHTVGGGQGGAAERASIKVEQQYADQQVRATALPLKRREMPPTRGELWRLQLWPPYNHFSCCCCCCCCWWWWCCSCV
jgi:hypothetical protein